MKKCDCPGDGGPAFPTTSENWTGPTDGMTLRDWFAGQALAGMVSQLSNSDIMEAVVQVAEKEGTTVQALQSEKAFRYADAMLKARNA